MEKNHLGRVLEFLHVRRQVKEDTDEEYVQSSDHRDFCFHHSAHRATPYVTMLPDLHSLLALTLLYPIPPMEI